MKRTKYTAEFKEEAVKQVIDKGHAVPDVAKRLGVAEGVLYTWVSKFKKLDGPESNDLKVMQAEMDKLKAECNEPLKTCTGHTIGETNHEYDDGRRYQEMDGQAQSQDA